jgi:prefoldin subunit 5
MDAVTEAKLDGIQDRIAELERESKVTQAELESWQGKSGDYAEYVRELLHEEQAEIWLEIHELSREGSFGGRGM